MSELGSTQAVYREQNRVSDGVSQRRLITAGLLLGVGLGGFLDGIILHQLLQWHHMLSSEGSYPSDTIAGLEKNTLWDGLFHVSAWIATFAGIWILRASLNTGITSIKRKLAGLILAGWGLFNLVEGIIDHHILGIHHVKAGPNELLLDLAFLTLGAVLIVGGSLLYRSGE